MHKKFNATCLGMAFIISAVNTVYAVSETTAAKETYVENIKLLPPHTLPHSVSQSGIYIAYVPQDTQLGRGKYFCGGLNAAATKQASQSISRALKRIPPNSLKRIKLKYILLCDKAKANNRDIGGIPVPPIKLLMLNKGNNSSDDYLQRTFLHELYHMAELITSTYQDKQWDTQFGGGYKQTYSHTQSQTRWGTGGLGYINAYARSFSHEDRAELFANGLMDGSKLKNYALSKQDKVLQDKLKYMDQKIRKILEMEFL